MQKKPGQISSNTLSLRFMQNAAKARQEREVEAAKARVKTEEEWELPLELRDGWKREVDDQTVSYEPSYLPFLFSGPSNASKNFIPVADIKAEPDDSYEDGDNYDESTVINYKGRRKFGKHGKEAAEVTPIPPPPAPISPNISLPHGFRSISSHGHPAGASSQSKSSRRPSRRVVTPPPPPPPPPQNFNVKVSSPPKIQGFMKPKVDAPRAREDEGARKKRPAQGTSESSNGNNPDEIDNGKRRKKRKE